MPSATGAPQAPGLTTFLKSLKTKPIEASIEQLISLLKRRQIRNSRPCAVATTHLMLRVVSDCKHRDPENLMTRIREVGRRLVAAQPRELVVGNMVRRVLGLVREVVDVDNEAASEGASGANTPRGGSMGRAAGGAQSKRPALVSSMSVFSPLRNAATQATDNMSRVDETVQGAADKMSTTPKTPTSAMFSREPTGMARPPLLPTGTSFAPGMTSLFGLFSAIPEEAGSGSSTPRFHLSPTRPGTIPENGDMASLRRGSPTSNMMSGSGTLKDIRPEVLEGIREMLDELDQVDEQIASFAEEHIHSSEIILTHSSSLTVQKFLLKVAKRRKFTVVHVESYPNDSVATYDTLLHGANPSADPANAAANAADGSSLGEDGEERWKPLTSLGITVIMIPDSAVYALMSRVNKVLLATHAVLANGGLVASAGARTIAAAAKKHQTPVVVLSGVYKLSPIYPFDMDGLIEWGEAGKVCPFSEGEFVEGVDVMNPVFDYVPPELVDLYITNLGGHAPSYLYRIVSDHYHVADTEL